MSVNEIRERLARYLAKEFSIDDFEDWIAQNTWNVHIQGDADASQLAYAIEGKLAEYSGEALSEDALRRELLPYVTFYTGRLPFAPATEPEFRSETKWYLYPAGVLRIVASADKSPVVVFG